MPGQQFQLDADAGARQWLDSHRSARGRVIAYNVQRCCGGGTICQVRVRELSRRDDPDEFTSGTLPTAPGSWSTRGRQPGCHRTSRSLCEASAHSNTSTWTSRASNGERSSTT